MDTGYPDHWIGQARPIGVVPGRLLRPTTGRRVETQQKAWRWRRADGPWHLPIECYPPHHWRRAHGFHGSGIDARTEWPLHRGGAVDGVDDEVPIGCHRFVWILIWPARPEFPEHQWRKGLSRDGTGIPL